MENVIMIVHTTQGQTYIGEFDETDDSVVTLLKPCVLNQKIVVGENGVPMVTITPVPFGFAAASETPTLRIPLFDVTMQEVASLYYTQFYKNIYSGLKKIHDSSVEDSLQEMMISEDDDEPTPPKVDISGLQ